MTSELSPELLALWNQHREAIAEVVRALSPKEQSAAVVIVDADNIKVVNRATLARTYQEHAKRLPGGSEIWQALRNERAKLLIDPPDGCAYFVIEIGETKQRQMILFEVAKLQA